MINKFKLIMRALGYDISNARKILDEISSLSKKNFYEWQDRKKWEIAKYHYLNNNFYKNKIGRSFPDDWSKLPILNKRDYQQQFTDLISNNFSDKSIYKSNTSGSSGHPFHFAKDKFSHSLTWAYSKRRYEQLGIKNTDLEARFYGIPLNRLGYYSEKVKDYLLNRYRFPIFDLSDENLKEILKIFRKKNFKFIYGYTNSILIFAKYIIRKKIDINHICPTLNLVIVTSEMCSVKDKRLISKAFSVPVYNEYGASEFNYIGIDNRKGGWDIAEEMVFVETNKTGDLLVTDLHNLAFPFIRYNLGDIVELSQNPKGKKSIKKMIGRVNDNIYLPSGKISPGLTFYYVSKSLLESSGVIKEFVVRQTHLNKFIFEVVSDREISNIEKKLIKESMNEYLEPGLKVTIKKVDKIKRQSSGKIKHFFSELNMDV